MTKAIPTTKKPNSRQGWKQNPESVKADILKVATAEIASNGLAGSRINEIAEKCQTSKRMIYYYFSDKEGLYRAVLEAAYHSVREGEAELALDHLSPIAAMERLVDFTFRHHRNNPDFIRLIMIENIHHGKFLKHIESIKPLNESAINRIATIYERGLQEGYFRDGISPLELHWYISAFSFFNVSNQVSFNIVFGEELLVDGNVDSLIQHIQEMLLRFILKPEHAQKYFIDSLGTSQQRYVMRHKN
jgi:AcrR family transcriptional regulator